MGQNPCPLGKGSLGSTPQCSHQHHQHCGSRATVPHQAPPALQTDTNQLQNSAFTNKLSSKAARLQGPRVSPKIVPRHQMCPRCAFLLACEKRKARVSCNHRGPPPQERGTSSRPGPGEAPPARACPRGVRPGLCAQAPARSAAPPGPTGQARGPHTWLEGAGALYAAELSVTRAAFSLNAKTIPGRASEQLAAAAGRESGDWKRNS